MGWVEGAQTESRRGSNGGYGKGAQLGGRRKAEWKGLRKEV